MAKSKKPPKQNAENAPSLEQVLAQSITSSAMPGSVHKVAEPTKDELNQSISHKKSSAAQPVETLDRYRAKRNAGATPEPMASVAVHHAAAADGATASEPQPVLPRAPDRNQPSPQRAAASDQVPAATRNAAAAPEPSAAPGNNVVTSDTPRVATVRTFVVHEHHATQKHFDLRLEIDGVLISWAVPHGPSMNPDEKRLAIKVEAHPLEYANFEAVIPPGNYGAGPMICWDRGRFVPEGDPAVGLVDGEIKFALWGYKLRGNFTLVHTGKARHGVPSRASAPPPNQWLLIKKRDDAAAAAGGAPLSPRSVLSGLTVTELALANEQNAKRVAALHARGLPRGTPALPTLVPMLCATATAPFSSPDWVFELKYDGYRALAHAGAGVGELRYRSKQVATPRFPEIASALRALPYPDMILDGELVVLDAGGRPDFHKLAGRAQLARTSEIARAAVATPVTYMVFDLLSVAGYDLRGLPLLDRKQLLRELLPPLGPLAYADHVPAQGEAMLRAVVAQGLEGIVAKRAAAPYRGARHPDWQKIKRDPEADFVICGYTPPKGSRVGFGALHLCVWTPTGWLWAGKVGTGFDDKLLLALHAQLQNAARWHPTFARPEGSNDAVWIEPSLVCRVRYREWPSEHALRFPVFDRLRDDVAPEACTMPARSTAQWEPLPAASATEAAQPGPQGTTRPSTHAAGNAAHALPHAPHSETENDSPAFTPTLVTDAPTRELRLSNPKKVYWPATDTAPAITKGELIQYYRDIAPWILPYLAQRPTVLTRYPDGIEGHWFYQKDMPEWTPPWLRTVNLWSDHSSREVHYLLVDDADGLAYLANLGSIPVHVWASTAEQLENPDWTIIDLDPKGAPREHVVPLALAIHALCEDLDIAHYVKTSGQTGLHILIPLAKQFTFEQARTFALILASIIEQRHPEMCTTQRNPKARGGRVYLDWGQNAHGQLLVAPFSVRPVPGAPVSMPLHWHEVTPQLVATQFHLHNAKARMDALGADPCLPVLSQRQDLTAAILRLERLLQRPRN